MELQGHVLSAHVTMYRYAQVARVGMPSHYVW